MALGTKLMMRQGQSLVMTPQLLQAIKLLQFSNMELTAFVQEELERNPLLERSDEAPDRIDAPNTEPVADVPDAAVGQDFNEPAEADWTSNPSPPTAAPLRTVLARSCPTLSMTTGRRPRLNIRSATKAPDCRRPPGPARPEAERAMARRLISRHMRRRSSASRITLKSN